MKFRHFVMQICNFYVKQPIFFRSEWPQQPEEIKKPIDPYILYGPHGYRTYSHARCQEVPTVDINLQQVSKK